MQFKRQGSRIQVLAYRGYDKEKRRSIVSMLGTIGLYDNKPSDGLLSRLTDEELAELQTYITSKIQSDTVLSDKYIVSNIPSRIKEVSDCIKMYRNDSRMDLLSDSMSSDWSVGLFRELDELERVLRKLKIRRQTKPEPKPEPSNDLFSA